MVVLYSGLTVRLGSIAVAGRGGNRPDPGFFKAQPKSAEADA
jgi:hypothetical protein